MRNGITLIIFFSLLSMTAVGLKASEKGYTIIEEDPEIARILAYGILNPITEEWPKPLTKETASLVVKNFNTKINELRKLLKKTPSNDQSIPFELHQTISKAIEYIKSEGNKQDMQTLQSQITLLEQQRKHEEEKYNKVEREKAAYFTQVAKQEEDRCAETMIKPKQQQEQKTQELQAQNLSLNTTKENLTICQTQNLASIDSLNERNTYLQSNLDTSLNSIESLNKSNQELKANNAKLMILRRMLWDKISDNTFSELTEQEIEKATQTYLTELDKHKNVISNKNSPAAMEKIHKDVDVQKKFFKTQAIAYIASAGFFITLIAYLLERYDISPRRIIGWKA